jgi:Flp pilus assembly protein TadB
VSFLLLSAGIARVIPAPVGLGMALLWSWPAPAAVILGAAVGISLVARRREARSVLAAAWLRSLAGEMRAGGSLRHALVVSAAAFPELGLAPVARAAQVGRPLSEIGTALSGSTELRPAAAVLEVASLTGGSIVAVVEALAVEAADDHLLTQETRSLTVAARWSVGLVGGFPLVVLALQVVRGEVAAMLKEGPLSQVLVGLGALLLALGMGSVLVLMKRARR